jgi:hypothetical protein
MSLGVSIAWIAGQRGSFDSVASCFFGRIVASAAAMDISSDSKES